MQRESSWPRLPRLADGNRQRLPTATAARLRLIIQLQQPPGEGVALCRHLGERAQKADGWVGGANGGANVHAGSAGPWEAARRRQGVQGAEAPQAPPKEPSRPRGGLAPANQNEAKWANQNEWQGEIRAVGGSESTTLNPNPQP